MLMASQMKPTSSAEDIKCCVCQNVNLSAPTGITCGAFLCLNENKSSGGTSVSYSSACSESSDLQNPPTLEYATPRPSIIRREVDFDIYKIQSTYGDDDFQNRPLIDSVYIMSSDNQGDKEPKEYVATDFSDVLDIGYESPWFSGVYDYRRCEYIAMLTTFIENALSTEYLVCKVGLRRALQIHSNFVRHLDATHHMAFLDVIRSEFADSPDHEQQSIKSVLNFGDFTRNVILYASEKDLNPIMASGKDGRLLRQFDLPSQVDSADYPLNRTIVMIHRGLLELIQVSRPDDVESPSAYKESIPLVSPKLKKELDMINWKIANDFPFKAALTVIRDELIEKIANDATPMKHKKRWVRCQGCVKRFQSDSLRPIVCEKCHERTKCSFCHVHRFIVNPLGSKIQYVGPFIAYRFHDMSDWLMKCMAEPQMHRVRDAVFGNTTSVLEQAGTTLEDASTFIAQLSSFTAKLEQNQKTAFEALDQKFADIPNLISTLIASANSAGSGFEDMGFYFKTAAGISIGFAVISLLLIITTTLWRQHNPTVAESQGNDLPDSDVRSFSESVKSAFSKAGKMVDGLFKFPFKIGEFLQLKWASIDKHFKKIYILKQGCGAVATFASFCALVLEKFIKWISRGTLTLTEKQRDIEWRIFEATCAITTLRNLGEADVSFILASPLRRAAFCSSYTALCTFVDTYRTDSNSMLKATCIAADVTVRAAAPTFRAICIEEHPSMQYHAFGIALVGGPGVGKSYFMHKIVSYMCKRLREDFGISIPEEAQIYSKSECDAFFSGYADQFAMVIDDFCQTVQSELPSIMYKLVGDAKEHLNMAAIGDKGKSMSSRLVISTMNGNGYPTPVGVKDHQALHRRREFLVRMSVNPQYIINGEYGPRPSSIYWENEDYWMFEKLNPYHLPDTCVGQPITNKTEMLEELYQGFLAHHKRKYPGPDVFSGTFPIVRQGMDDFLSPECELLVYQPTIDKDHMELIKANARRIDDYRAEIGSSSKYVVASEEVQTPEEQLNQRTRQIKTRAVETFYALRGKRTFQPHGDAVVIHMSEHHVESLFGFGSRVLHETRTSIVKSWTEFWSSNKTVSETFMRSFQNIKDMIPAKESFNFWAMLVMLVEAGIIGGLIYYVVKKLTAVAQSAVGKDKTKLTKTKPLQVGKLRLEEPQPVAAAQSFSMLDEGSRRVVKAVCSNSVAIVSPSGNPNQALSHGVMLCEQYLLMNKHCYNDYKGSPYVTLVSNLSGARWNVDLAAKPCLVVGSGDFVVVNLKNQNIQPFPDIRKHIIDQDENIVVPGMGVFPILIDQTLGYEMMRMGWEANYKSELGIGDYYTYPVSTQRGYCGLPVFGITANKRVKMIGIHALGYTDTPCGMAQPLTSNVFEDLKTIMPPFQYAEKQGSIPTPPNFHQIGYNGSENFMPTKSSFIPSPIAGMVVPVTDAPSILSQKDSNERGNGNHPIIAGLTGYLDPIKPLDQKILQEATNDVALWLKSFPGQEDYSTVLTDFETLNGNHLPYLGHIDMTTSPGYPYSQERTKPGKYDFIELEGDTLKISNSGAGENFRLKVQEVEEAAKNEKRVASVWVDGLKDELLPQRKIDITKTRIFVGGPLHHTYLVRKYFGGFTAFTMKNRIHNCMAPGLVESQVDWFLLYKKLEPFGDNIVAGDYTQWDKHLDTTLIFAACDAINQWYDGMDEENNVRRTLMHEIAYSFVLCGNTNYLKDRGNPSGCAITTPLNNLCQLILFRYFWIKYFRSLGMHELVPMKVQHDLTYICVYGDDHIMGVHDSIKDLWNQVVIQKLCADIGMVYTDISKTDRIAPFCRMDQAVFLQRKFVPFEGVCLGVREIDDILSTLNWVRKKEDTKTALAQNITMVAMELWKHGEALYDTIMDKIAKACLEKGIGITYPSYECQRSTWRAQIFQYGSACPEGSIPDISKMHMIGAQPAITVTVK